MTERPARFWEVAYYNWSWEERCAVIPIQTKAFRDGVLRRPDTCSICCFYGPGKRDGRWQIVAHLERYDRPLEIYPCCRRCHASLHARFADPARWQRLVERHPAHGSWYELLSCDPASQWQPFDVVHPVGLPPPPPLREPNLFDG